MSTKLAMAGGLMAGAIGLGAGAAGAVAAPATTGWTCSASTAIANVAGQPQATLDPLRANPGADDLCRDDGSTVPSLDVTNPLSPAIPLPAALRSGTAFAQTALGGAGGPLARQTAAAQAGAEDLDLNVGNGALRIQAAALVSQAVGRCVNGAPAFSSDGRVVGLRVNGQEITADTQLGQLTDALAATPLAGLVRVQLNKVLTSGAGTADERLVREAVRVEILSAVGTPVVTVVLGRAVADRHGDVCAAVPGDQDGDGVPDGPGSTGGGSNTGGGSSTTGVSNTTGGGSNTNSSSGATKGSTGSGSGSSTTARPNGVNASSCARLRMFFAVKGRGRKGIATSGPQRITSRFGVRQVTRGRIVNCRGKGIVRARIDVYHVVRGKKRLIKTGLRSRPGGALTLILPLNITSREVRYEYRPFVNRTKVASRQTLRVKVMRRGRVI